MGMAESEEEKGEKRGRNIQPYIIFIPNGRKKKGQCYQRRKKKKEKVGVASK